MSLNLKNSEKISSKNTSEGEKTSLRNYFNWYEKSFCEKLTAAGSEFLASEIKFKLVGISEEPCKILHDSDYFVTQVNLSRENAVTIKVSDTAANIIFRSALGDRPKETGYLKFKDITELEAKILTAFNEFIFKKISENFLTPKEIKSIENETTDLEGTTYLTFYITGNSKDEAGKIIFIFPQFVFRSLKPVIKPRIPLNIDYFNICLVETDIIAGYSRITLDDVKNLDIEDIVNLEKSNLYSMILKNHENLSININPNQNIAINIDDLDKDNGDDTVSKVTGNIWDSLEVDLSAEFDKVKIRLGDLRHIIEGLVIDVAPIAQNKLFLNVEGKQVAAGELVIVGDKYGVKITEVYNEAKPINPEHISATNYQGADNVEHQSSEEKSEENDEIDESDFDFSDYEIEEDV